MKSLPRLYKNDKSIKNNNKNNCVVEERIVNNTIHEDIKQIFNSPGFPFDKRVLIKTKDKIIKTYLVSENENTITTLNDEIIKIEEIISIERI